MYCTSREQCERLGRDWLFWPSCMLALPATAQDLGRQRDQACQLNGEIGAGYAGAFGNRLSRSSHGIFFTGVGPA